ncbi:hypothetical protein PPERSA_10638 [Pseudocohnilembus persalinus]|uniref:Peptidase M14 domain-containing protein n=1 Tax=Pseudocohnilembus persalinus TaxID=266149 RepID=A0A0V0QD66_PSEPJ|nr:hypothetical protein PPERSA_10638 [Pseudocohnilembus persalinus]|eukprot:KRX00139.1 hypothetical protein PPERSA_10638 [Pseudocohnilembus persalinus]
MKQLDFKKEEIMINEAQKQNQNTKNQVEVVGIQNQQNKMQYIQNDKQRSQKSNQKPYSVMDLVSPIKSSNKVTDVNKFSDDKIFEQKNKNYNQHSYKQLQKKEELNITVDRFSEMNDISILDNIRGSYFFKNDQEFLENEKKKKRELQKAIKRLPPANPLLQKTLEEFSLPDFYNFENLSEEEMNNYKKKYENFLKQKIKKKININVGSIQQQQISINLLEKKENFEAQLSKEQNLNGDDIEKLIKISSENSKQIDNQNFDSIIDQCTLYGKYFKNLKEKLVYQKIDNAGFNQIYHNNTTYVAGLFCDIKKIVNDDTNIGLTEQYQNEQSSQNIEQKVQSINNNNINNNYSNPILNQISEDTLIFNSNFESGNLFAAFSMKNDSLFNYGMKPVCFSLKNYQKGWQRLGNKISYKKSQIYKESSGGYNQENLNSKNKLYELVFTINFEDNDDTVFIAHCFPYTYSKLQSYLEQLQTDEKKSQFVSKKNLCKTVSKNVCDILTITNPSKENNKKGNQKDEKFGVILTARQHPGESAGSVMMEGILDLLTDPNDPVSEFLRRNCVFKVIPMLNPDGVIHGNYRCNMAGVDLNRQWDVTDKDSTARQALYYMLETSNIYTFEASFYGYKVDYRNSEHFTFEEFKNLGKDICRALAQYIFKTLSNKEVFTIKEFIENKDKSNMLTQDDEIDDNDINQEFEDEDEEILNERKDFMDGIINNEELMKENNNNDSGSDSNPSEDELTAKEIGSLSVQKKKIYKKKQNNNSNNYYNSNNSNINSPIKRYINTGQKIQDFQSKQCKCGTYHWGQQCNNQPFSNLSSPTKSQQQQFGHKNQASEDLYNVNIQQSVRESNLKQYNLTREQINNKYHEQFQDNNSNNNVTKSQIIQNTSQINNRVGSNVNILSQKKKFYSIHQRYASSHVNTNSEEQVRLPIKNSEIRV